MKIRMACTAVIALLVSTNFASAQQSENGKNKRKQDQLQNRGEKQRGGQNGGQGGGGLFRLLDIDRDGNLSAKEIDVAVVALLKLDVNKDGILDAQELVVRGGKRGGGGPVGKEGRGGQGNRSANSKGKSE